MTIRSRRRQQEGTQLEGMTTAQLEEIKFFGNLAYSPETIVFRATEAEQARAAEILKERAARS